MRLLKPRPVIVISSFTVPAEGLMLLIEGEKHLESSKRNVSELLTPVLFRPHKGSVAWQPSAELPVCKFTGSPSDKRTACKSWMIF